jgi:hypothetical protein
LLLLKLEFKLIDAHLLYEVVELAFQLQFFVRKVCVAEVLQALNLYVLSCRWHWVFEFNKALLVSSRWLLLRPLWLPTWQQKRLLVVGQVVVESLQLRIFESILVNYVFQHYCAFIIAALSAFSWKGNA